MSEDFDLVVTGGTVVTPGGPVEADLAVRGETIAEIGPGLAARAARTVEATGRVVLPGVIDAHVHCRTWTDHSDELADSHRSAAFGGVTTAVTQIRADVGMAPGDAIRHFVEVGEAHSVIDFGLHAILRPEHDLDTAIPDVVGLGVPSVKFFMAYKDNGIMTPDALLLRGFELARDNGALTMVHAEDGELIARLIADARAAGRTGLADFAAAQPASSEDLGTIKAIAYAAAIGNSLYVLHMTTSGAVRALREAQAAGQPVWGESCPKYLLLTNDDLLAKGPLAKVGPPLRTRADNEALWSGIADGTVSAVASDHAPRDRASLTETADVFADPYGAPGTETMLPVIYDEMVVRRGRPLTELAAVLATNPAKIYGLYPRKGVLQVGSDADIVVVDPARPTVIRAAGQHTRATYSLYEGRTVAATPTHTFVRGRAVLADGELVQEPGYGTFLPRRPEDLGGLPLGSHPA
jgi:dihydropyrimidinase